MEDALRSEDDQAMKILLQRVRSVRGKYALEIGLLARSESGVLGFTGIVPRLSKVTQH